MVEHLTGNQKTVSSNPVGIVLTLSLFIASLTLFYQLFINTQLFQKTVFCRNNIMVIFVKKIKAKY